MIVAVSAFAEGFYLGEDGVPAAAIDGMLVACRSVCYGAIVTLGYFEECFAVIFGEPAGDGEIVFGEVWNGGVVGIDDGVDEGLVGFDAKNPTFYGDHFNAIEGAFPDEGAARLPIGKRLTAEHVLFRLLGVGEGIPDFCGRGVNADRVLYDEGLWHSVFFLYCNDKRMPAGRIAF
jgi:hypothetical protein